MAKPYDIKLDDDSDLLVDKGDFVVGISEAQNLDHLLKAVPGGIKTEPTTGIGVVRWAKKRMNVLDLYSTVNAQLKADGWQNEDLAVNEQEVIINAERDE